MKRIVIACDGTWQDLDEPYATNVRLLARAVTPRDGQTEQLVYYAPGIGTRNVFEKLTGGAFGAGINVEISAAYAFLCANYNPGDELYLFGFSRGAYTVRSLAGLIASCGILRREELDWVPNAYSLYRRLDGPDREAMALELQTLKGHGQTSENPETSDIRIHFLGVWDTVGALGIPNISSALRLDSQSRDQHRFHNTYLSPLIDHARHAVAIDERRSAFYHTEMNLAEGTTPRSGQLRQVWFPGDHGSVGGGRREKRPHSDAALAWMVDELDALPGSKLQVDRHALDLTPDPMAGLSAKRLGLFRRLSNPLEGRQPDNPRRDRRSFCAFEDIHPSALTRWVQDRKYRPRNLKEAHGDRLNAMV